MRTGSETSLPSRGVREAGLRSWARHPRGREQSMGGTFGSNDVGERPVFQTTRDGPGVNAALLQPLLRRPAPIPGGIHGWTLACDS